jgi:hypothetical protein
MRHRHKQDNLLLSLVFLNNSPSLNQLPQYISPPNRGNLEAKKGQSPPLIRETLI